MGFQRMLGMVCSLCLLAGLHCSECSAFSSIFVIWRRFRQMRRDWVYRPEEEGRIHRLLDYASPGSPRHGSIHLLVTSALCWSS